MLEGHSVSEQKSEHVPYFEDIFIYYVYKKKKTVCVCQWDKPRVDEPMSSVAVGTELSMSVTG